MITEDEVMRLLERADPARRDVAASAADAAGYLAALSTRSSNVTLIDTEPTPTRPPHRHRWAIIVVAAAAVAAIVVGGLVLGTRDEDPSEQVPADTVVAPDALEVAMGFLDAYGAFDAERALSYLTAEAIDDARPVEFASTPEEFRRELAVWKAFRYRHTITGCETVGESPSGIAIRCAFDRHELGSNAVGLGPYTDNYWELTVRDGKLTSAASEWTFTRSSPERWVPFSRWVATNHPDEVLVLYETDAQTQYANTDEAAVLLKQRVDEFVAQEVTRLETAGTFMDAWIAGDGDAAADLFTADGQWEDVAAGELPAVHDWLRAVAADYRSDGCRLRPAMGDVECPYSVDNDVTRFLGVGPIADRFVVEVVDGAITSVNDVPNEELDQVWSTFADWVAENHPDDVERMFIADTTEPRLDAASIELWDLHVDEFTATDAVETTAPESG